MQTIQSSSFATCGKKHIIHHSWFGSLCDSNVGANARLAWPRWDKYESKTAYWVEEDLECEFESSRSKSVKETSQYETDQPASDTLFDASMPPTMDTDEIKNMQTGQVWVCGESGNKTPSPL